MMDRDLHFHMTGAVVNPATEKHLNRSKYGIGWKWKDKWPAIPATKKASNESKILIKRKTIFTDGCREDKAIEVNS